MRSKEITLNNIQFIVYEDGTIKRKSDGFQPTYWKGNRDKTYLRVCIYNGAHNRKAYYVHRVLAHAFLDLPLDSKLTVDHLDGNGFNNSLDNLEVVTLVENLRRYGRSYKLIDHVDLIKEEDASGLSTYQQIVDSYGVHKSSIDQILNGRSYSKPPVTQPPVDRG